MMSTGKGLSSPALVAAIFFRLFLQIIWREGSIKFQRQIRALPLHAGAAVNAVTR